MGSRKVGQPVFRKINHNVGPVFYKKQETKFLGSIPLISPIPHGSTGRLLSFMAGEEKLQGVLSRVFRQN